MKSPLFIVPQLIYGEGARFKAGTVCSLCGITRLFVISSRSVRKTTAFSELLGSIQHEGIPFFLHEESYENPSDRQVEHAVFQYRAFDADGLLAVGGGSVLDCAKATGILVTNAPPLRRYERLNSLSSPIPPLVCIPTTAGTGAEVTPCAVVNNEEQKYKMVLYSDFNMLPRAALVDPVFSLTMPPHIIRSSGMDAFTHALEAVMSPFADTMSDIFARSALCMIQESLPSAILRDCGAQGRMVLASLLGGIAMNAWCGAIHALAHPLTAHFGIPHGIAVGIMMPYVMDFNLAHNKEKEGDLAEILRIDRHGEQGKSRTEQILEALRELQKKIEIPLSLKETNADPALFAACTDAALNDSDLSGNPCPVSREEILRIYACAFEGALPAWQKKGWQLP